MMISKSDLRLYLDSPRHLWAKFHGVWKPEVSDFTKKTAEDGYKVEKLATEYLERYFAGDGKILKTQETFRDGEFMARTDALVYDATSDTYDLFEIKSSTFDEADPKLDKTNLYDITYQALILEKQIKVRGHYLLMLNANYRRGDELNLKELFMPVEVSEKIEELRNEVLNIREEMLLISRAENCRGFEACFSPKNCGCPEICHPDLPEHNIYQILSRSRRKIMELREQGILSIFDLPEDLELSGKAGTLISVYKGPDRLFDAEKIKEILDSYEYPIYFLDYETISEPIPQFKGIRPYQNLATQYSLHVVYEDGRLEHFEYIYEGEECPLYYTVNDMVSRIGSVGTVLAWNEGFEKRVNRNAAESYPELAEKLLDINNRVRDLGEAFKELYYMDRNFHGSWSIKKVLPVMCPDCSYKELLINHGDQASSEWLRMNSPETSREEKDQIKHDLLKYCELDTFAMVRIWQELNKLTKEA